VEEASQSARCFVVPSEHQQRGLPLFEHVNGATIAAAESIVEILLGNVCPPHNGYAGGRTAQVNLAAVFKCLLGFKRPFSKLQTAARPAVRIVEFLYPIC
jgi:hypothetical protein